VVAHDRAGRKITVTTLLWWWSSRPMSVSRSWSVGARRRATVSRTAIAAVAALRSTSTGGWPLSGAGSRATKILVVAIMLAILG
jgi:hypothetical protein